MLSEGTEHTCLELIEIPSGKLSLKEWQDLILAELRGKGGSRYYSAICPICLTGYEVDISSARALAVEKVASHIKSAHSNALT
jgi:hypothetical protein